MTGPETKMLIDRSLGEVLGPSVKSEATLYIMLYIRLFKDNCVGLMTGPETTMLIDRSERGHAVHYDI